MGVRATGAWVWQPHHLHVPNVMKYGSLNFLEPSGPHRACYGTHFFTCEVEVLIVCTSYSFVLTSVGGWRFNADTCSVFILWLFYNPMQFMSICWYIWRTISTVHGMNNIKFQRIKHRTTLAWTMTALLVGSPDIRAGTMLFFSAHTTNKMHVTSYPGSEHSPTPELRIHASMAPLPHTSSWHMLN